MSTNEKTAVSKVEETKDKKAETKAENKKEELKKTDKEAEKAAEEEDEEEEINPDELFKHRESIPLTPENAWFSASVGGLISLKIVNAEGETEEFERVVIRRSFPVTAPNEFLSVREPDTRKKGRGSEIGMIRDLSVFDKDTVALINAELDLRYFTPEIKRITAAKEKFGYCYWEADTSAGHVSFVLNNPFSNIRKLEDGRILIADMDGNCFLIPDPEALDRQSYKVIEIYI
ncbi:MAG: DUF1854 domain-containing protein [Clostridia bacterium]|nr:DUF1854 domain-containing protein [Clostridia bacterium]